MSLIYEIDIHKEFTKWAVARGVKPNGIATHRFPGRDSVSSQRKNSKYAGDTLLTVPISALRTVQTVPKSISKPIGTITVQGLLAAELAMDTSEVRAPWRAVLPTEEDFKESMPLMWHPSLQMLLPPGSSSLLENQKQKLSVDWTTVSTAFPTLSSPKIKTKKPKNHDDCLALVPFADYFNHADVGPEVTFSPSGYKICTDRQIEKGEEIYISYGNHEENKWDEITLDEAILPLFSEEQKQTLKEAGFLVALRLLCMLPNRWLRLVADGFEDEDKYQVAANKILLKCLNAYLDIVHESLKQVEVLDCGFASQRDTLSRRWKQIRLLLTTAISRIQNL
ncbi:hypothetical protein BDZ45DRAFT_719250 [Acephala macrosclerotiorum]|nr:hypothetical protein BDZ45DRAFT_719250 [Acephala macrosclerotiorum]